MKCAIFVIFSIFVLHGQMQCKNIIKPIVSRSCPSENYRFFIMEIWKEIPGFENLYEASNTGKIRSRRRELKQYWHNKTYYTLCLSKNNKTKTHTVHRLVLMTFIPNLENRFCINHKDGNPKNNNISNLEWCTHSYNNKHAYRIGLMKSGQNHHYAKLNNIQVRVIRKCQDLSQREIGKIFGVCQGTISLIKLNINWNHLK